MAIGVAILFFSYLIIWIKIDWKTLVSDAKEQRKLDAGRTAEK